MSDLSLIASRLPGATGAISALAITATVPDPPKNFIALDNGTILRGTVQGRDKDGLITIKTDHGYLKIATNANLQPGANVTLEVRSVGDRLQVVVLAADQGAGHPIDLHGSAIPPGVTENSGDAGLDGRIGGSSPNHAVDPASRSATTATAESKQTAPTVIVAGTRLTAIVIQALPRELLHNPAASLQQASGPGPNNLQPPAVDGLPASGRALFTADFLPTPPPPISASLLPDIHDRIAALFAESPSQQETAPTGSSVAPAGLTLPPETRERIVALFVGQQPNALQSTDIAPEQAQVVGNSSAAPQIPPKSLPLATQVAQPLPSASSPAGIPQPSISSNEPAASVPAVPTTAVPAPSSAVQQQPIALPPAPAQPPIATDQQPLPTSGPQQSTPTVKNFSPAQPPFSAPQVTSGAAAQQPAVLSPSSASPPFGVSQPADGRQGQIPNADLNTAVSKGTVPGTSQSSAGQTTPPTQTQIGPSPKTAAANVAAISEPDIPALALGKQQPAAATVPPSGAVAATRSSPTTGQLASDGMARADLPPQQPSPGQLRPDLPPRPSPELIGTSPQQQTPPPAADAIGPAATAASRDLAAKSPPPIGVSQQSPAAAVTQPAAGTINNTKPLSPPSLQQSPAPESFVTPRPNTGPQATTVQLPAPSSSAAAVPVTQANNLPPQLAGAIAAGPAGIAPTALPQTPTPATPPQGPLGGEHAAPSGNPLFQSAPAPYVASLQPDTAATQPPTAPSAQASPTNLSPVPANVPATSAIPSAPAPSAVPQAVAPPTAAIGTAASPISSIPTAATTSMPAVTSGQVLVGSDAPGPQSQPLLNSLQNSQPSAPPSSSLPSSLTSTMPPSSSQLPPVQINPDLLAQLVSDAPDLVTAINQPSTQAGSGLSGAINPTLLQIIANVAAQPSAVAWIAGHAAVPANTTASQASPEQSLLQPGQGQVPSVSPANLPANLIAIANAIPQDTAVPPSPITPVPTSPGIITPGNSTSTDTTGQSAPKTATTATATSPKSSVPGAVAVNVSAEVKDSGIPLTALVSSLSKVPLTGTSLATANAEYLATNLAVSGASDSTVSKLDLTGKEQLAGPLPTGTEVRLRVLNIQTQAGPLVSMGATPGNKAAITGQILGHTPAGHPVIHTALGDLVLQQQATLPVGGEITLALEAVEMANSASNMTMSLTPQMTAMNLAQGWPTLLDLLMTLQHGLAANVPTTGAPGETGDAGSMAHLPQPGSKLAAGMAAAVDAFRTGDFEKLFGPLASSVKSAGTKQDAVRKLRDEFGQLSILAQDRGNQDWKCFMLPVWDDGRLQQINLFYRRPRRQQSDGKDKNDDATRFVVDVNFTKLGGCQLDGLIHKKTFDLMVRSHQELPISVKRDIAGLFAQARDIGNYAGEVSFQTALRFPVSPLDDIAKGPPSVTA